MSHFSKSNPTQGPAQNRRPARNRGFALLEVLVAVAILGASLAVLLAAVNRSLVLNAESKGLLTASSLAQVRLAEIELEGFPEAGAGSGVFEDHPGFEWSVVIDPLILPELEAEIMLVELTIFWEEGEKQFVVSYAIANDE